MASSKTFLLLGLVFAVVLLISSSVSARELAEAAQIQENVKTEAVEEANYGDHKHGHGHGHGHHGHGHGHGHHGHPGHGAADETETDEN
ncbi:glycine-rich protein DC7.1-like [Corylus avellana]|uniref:glycine-rich protein DC7.1-like n=1 Tax=Corylus avellana TaxID=13451 RepID=UPI001E237507|nr:glycine-rich protein DC7.1-like [Corylus avellana]XP_059444731.1 glycine-rich protein DC7.1-like [Corylus avellana]